MAPHQVVIQLLDASIMNLLMERQLRTNARLQTCAVPAGSMEMLTEAHVLRYTLICTLRDLARRG